MKPILFLFVLLSCSLSNANANIDDFDAGYFVRNGLDVEHILSGTCAVDLRRYNPKTHLEEFGFCPELEKLAESGTKWIRLLALWRWDEINPPTPTDSPAPGSLSGLHKYSWTRDEAQNTGCAYRFLELDYDRHLRGEERKFEDLAWLDPTTKELKVTDSGNSRDLVTQMLSRTTPAERTERCTESQLEYITNYAQRLGMDVYFTANWPPQWANGAECADGPDCAPIIGEGHNLTVGYAPTKPEYIEDLFHNLVTHFAVNRKTFENDPYESDRPYDRQLRPVRYFGVWNEPNFRSNFNPCNVTGRSCVTNQEDDTGYIEAFVKYYLEPARRGMNSALDISHTSREFTKLVAPDLADRCGIPRRYKGVAGFLENILPRPWFEKLPKQWISTDRDCWINDWAKPLLENSYYSSLFDIISFHRYDGTSWELRDNADKLGKLLVKDPKNPNSARTQYWKPAWMTEAGGWNLVDRTEYEQARNMFWLTWDRNNRRHWWQMSFYAGTIDVLATSEDDKDPAHQPCKGSGLYCHDLNPKKALEMHQWLAAIAPEPSWWGNVRYWSKGSAYQTAARMSAVSESGEIQNFVLENPVQESESFDTPEHLRTNPRRSKRVVRAIPIEGYLEIPENFYLPMPPRR